jgi:hypothetical protein
VNVKQFKSRKTLLGVAGALIASFCQTGTASAATDTFQYSGSLASQEFSMPTDGTGTPVIADTIPLIDAVNGLNLTPGFVLSVGDTLTGSAKLDGPLTVPGSTEDSELYLNIISTEAIGSPYVFGDLSVTLSNKGVVVPFPAGFFASGGGVGTISIGGFDASASVPSYAFDTIDFSFTVKGIRIDDDTMPAQSIDIPSSPPSLEYIVFSPVAAPAPEPAAWAMMLLGFGMIGSAMRRRQIGTA